MKTITATIVHLGFRIPGETPGRKVIRLEVPEDSTQEQQVEAVFEADNAPWGKFELVEKEGRCYSTSVGDMVYANDYCFRCDDMGWTLMASPAETLA